ncbi:MAG: hypothetical protein HYU51_19315 [Candidatus Rokubacteria bacterium]|nr:hypothetical protein [Candidatus Rokubacteria bacterium]
MAWVAATWEPQGWTMIGADARDAAAENPAPGRVVAVVKDLFFVARIRETARLAGVPLEFVKSVEALDAALGDGVRFALVDLTGGFDYERLFSTLEARAVPALAFTTHALARETQRWHGRCARVVTKETLTRELPALLRDGMAARDETGV